MMKRTCPECRTAWYSANAEAEFWRCSDCGTKISIEHQTATEMSNDFKDTIDRKEDASLS